MALIERKLEVVDWKKPDTRIAGYLTSAERVKFADGGTGMRYLLQRVDDSVVAFKGATQLDMRLSKRDLGSYIEIRYIGEDTQREMSEGRSRPKLFQVWFDQDRRLDNFATAADGATINDSDIPF